MASVVGKCKMNVKKVSTGVKKKTKSGNVGALINDFRVKSSEPNVSFFEPNAYVIEE